MSMFNETFEHPKCKSCFYSAMIALVIIAISMVAVLSAECGCVADSPPASDAGVVSCSADQVVMCGEECVVTVSITYGCDAAGTHWTRIGVLPDPNDGVDRFVDTGYWCGEVVIESWIIPCSSETVIVGATADDPVTRVDFSCMSGPLVVACF